MNYCRSCDNDFSSVKLFDRHRVGVHAYTYEEGLLFGADDGRRCLNEDEMTALGWEQRDSGTWVDPSSAEVGERLRGRTPGAT